MSRRLLACGIVVFCLAIAVLPLCFAIVPSAASSLDAKRIVLPDVKDRVVVSDEADAPTAPFEGFRSTIGGHWWGRVVANNGRASLVSGSGIELRLIGENAHPDLADFAAAVRDLVTRYPDFLAPTAGELLLSPSRSTLLANGQLAYIDFDLSIAGHRVRGAQVFARINHGRVIQLGTQLAGGEVDALAPVLDPEQASSALFSYLGGRGERDIPYGDVQLFYLPVREGSSLVYRLVYELAFRRGGEQATWTGRVSATTGKVLEFFDANLYGEVTGGTYERTIVDPEIERPFFDQRLANGTVTDRAGHFSFGGSRVSSSLSGVYFNTTCENCVNPSAASVEQDTGLGWLRFGLGGVDEVGNGRSTKAERNAFYHLTMIRLLTTKWLSIGWLNSNIRTNVNIDDTCNAFYNGTVNFFRSGGSCNNTGEIADVMQHEWGHGLDSHTQGGDSATGEGTADHVAFILQHHPVIGPYFRTSGAGVRDLDKDNNSRGLLTWSNVLNKCDTGRCSGPRGRECHCEGEIYGQTGWDLAQALVAKHGYHTGWQEFERIFFTSMPQAGTYQPNLANSIYDAYLAADDDDGNLANGTPNGQEIYDAFNLHEIASGPASSSPYCSRPAEPVVTVSDTCSAIELSWGAVTGATEYHILRQPLSKTKAFLPRATVTGTSFTDTEVAPGATYYYLVEAIDASGCRSTIEKVLTVTGPDKPRLGIVDVVTDDTPAGNRSGTIDPGEAIDVFLTLENLSTVTGSGLTGTIASSTPGVSIDVASQSFPDAADHTTTVNPTGFRFSLDETVDCGSVINFTFTVSDDSGCAVDTQYFHVKVGEDRVALSDNFDTDLGWSHDSASSTATSGDWTRGVPDATAYQPGSDANDAGTFCWFTAANPNGESGDDVDGGEVVLLSPVFDLTSVYKPTVNYQRWYANKDPGQDTDDYYWVEVSSDNGANWVTVEKLGTNDNAAVWTDVSFDLTPLITLTNQVRFRVRVSDGASHATTIEGGFDDFRIRELFCDDTPPCFVEPSFSGLDAANPGPDCAEASLSWSAASSNCLNAEISYTVYRSTSELFEPSPETKIAEGVTGLTYLDALLDPGQSYYYVVRAFDSRSGEDSNLHRLSVLAPSSPDSKAPLFDGLSSATPGTGCGEAKLAWKAARESCSTPVIYHVYRSTSPGFNPEPGNLIAETTAVSLTDAGLDPNVDYHYIVQAVDQATLSDGNLLEKTAKATVLPETMSSEDFETGAAGWARHGTNDASSGLWELGDPVKTDAQPGDCPSGTSCWATGLSGPGLGDNDVDDGTTTLLSAPFSLTGMAKPAIRYKRYYSNNTGATPGTDTWTVDISNDDGANWSTVEQTKESDVNFVFRQVEFALPNTMTPTAQMRVRFIASDLASGSLVEAEVDDFQTVDLVGGCDGCNAPGRVGTVLISREGKDLLLDWTADPITAGRYKVYTLTGATFAKSTLLASPSAKSYRHIDGAEGTKLTSYRVSALNACAEEGALQ